MKLRIPLLYFLAALLVLPSCWGTDKVPRLHSNSMEESKAVGMFIDSFELKGSCYSESTCFLWAEHAWEGRRNIIGNETYQRRGFLNVFLKCDRRYKRAKYRAPGSSVEDDFSLIISPLQAFYTQVDSMSQILDLEFDLFDANGAKCQLWVE